MPQGVWGEKQCKPSKPQRRDRKYLSDDRQKRDFWNTPVPNRHTKTADLIGQSPHRSMLGKAKPK